MSEKNILVARRRESSGKQEARHLRASGWTPGIVYGGSQPPQAISLPFKDLNHKIYAGGFLTKIFELNIDNNIERVIPKNYQLDVIRDTVLHVDFYRLQAGTEIRLEVPVHFINHELSPGLKRGGVLNIVRHAVEMWVPAENIPEALIADLAGHVINDSIHISQISLPAGCRPTIADRDFTIATIAAPAVYKEEGADAAAEEEKEKN